MPSSLSEIKANLHPTTTLNVRKAKHQQHKGRLFVNLTGHGYQVRTHASCVHNELRALGYRHLISRDVGFDAAFFKENMLDIETVSADKIGKLAVVNSYRGAKKNMYYRALLNVRESLDFNNWKRVRMFVKPDKYEADEVSRKEPRAIQYRSPEFNLLVAAHLRPLEHAYYEQLKSEVGLRVIAKGLNNHERASNIVQASELFENPVYLLLDHSKFDSHVRQEHLKWVYRQYYKSTRNRFLRYLTSMMLVNRGYTKHGIKYKILGTRMSGDYDTALGNTLINLGILRAYTKGIRAHILLDGDDSVIVMEKRDLCRLDDSVFGKMGMTTEKNVVYELQHVEFCRSLLLPLEKPVFARDYRRALSHMQVSEKWYDGKYRLRYLSGMARGELAASAGVPVIQAYAEALAGLSSQFVVDEQRLAAYGVGESLEVTDEARIAYYEAYGISPTEQLQMESALRLTPTEVATQDYYSLPTSKQQVI